MHACMYVRAWHCYVSVPGAMTPTRREAALKAKEDELAALKEKLEKKEKKKEEKAKAKASWSEQSPFIHL